jgi:hypothetical protein
MTLEEFLERIDGIVKGLGIVESYKLVQLYDEVTKPHWISVEDELPKLIAYKLLFDYSDDVLVYLKDGSITVGRWERDNSTGEQYWLLDIDKDVIVTHWMPLPQEPKKGGEQ